MKRKKPRDTSHDEPMPDADDLIECGGVATMPMGFTPAGFPYGLTLEEFREATALDTRAGWARAKSILAGVARAASGHEPYVDWVRKVGEGLSREVFAANVKAPAPWRNGVYAALLPRRNAPEREDRNRRVAKEAALLERLAGRELPIRVPRVMATVVHGESLVLVREFLGGIDVDLRAGRMHRVRPWELVAEIAASVHSIEVDDCDGLIDVYPTRRAHAHAILDRLADRIDLDDSLLADAMAWARAHMPGETETTLVHGDLLGQNILLDIAGEAPPALIDWEFAVRGDPARDLAIVTRGRRKPFQIADGLSKLLESYNARHSTPILEQDVHFHEVCLHVGFCADVGHEHHRNALTGFLRRLG